MLKFAGVAVAGASMFCAASAFAAEPSAKQVLAELTADLNGDGIKDRAVLLHDADGDDVDLAVYLSAGGQLPDKPSVYKPAFGWTGAMAGQEPELATNKAGSLVVVFQNDSIGRDRWRQQYTIAFRGGTLVVAGYDYESRDTLKPSHVGRCSINFLAGRGVRNGKPVQLTGPPPTLGDWTDKSVPAACNFD